MSSPNKSSIGEGLGDTSFLTNNDKSLLNASMNKTPSKQGLQKQIKFSELYEDAK